MILSRLSYFRRSPNYVHVNSVLTTDVRIETSTGWELARPFGEYGLIHRLKMAWLVFSGKAYALVWGGKQ